MRLRCRWRGRSTTIAVSPTGSSRGRPFPRVAFGPEVAWIVSAPVGARFGVSAVHFWARYASNLKFRTWDL